MDKVFVIVSKYSESSRRDLLGVVSDEDKAQKVLAAFSRSNIGGIEIVPVEVNQIFDDCERDEKLNDCDLT